MSVPILSIVIPVYNVQDFIGRCIESIDRQKINTNSFEVLLVDDGSKDASPAICDELAEKYNYIRAIHKTNGGLSDARNVGLNAATGDYVVFLDSDDYLEDNSLSNLLNSINHYRDVDIIAVTTRRQEGEKEVIIQHRSTLDTIMTGCEYLKNEFAGRVFITAWSSVYRRAFLLNNDLRFRVGVLHEDEDFTPRAFLKAKTVVNTSYPFYVYIIRPNSITTQKDKFRNAQCLYDINKDLLSIYSHVEDPVLRKLLKKHSAKICYKAFEFGQLYEKDRRHVIDYDMLRKCSREKLEVLKFCLLKIHPLALHWFNKILK